MADNTTAGKSRRRNAAAPVHVPTRPPAPDFTVERKAVIEDHSAQADELPGELSRFSETVQRGAVSCRDLIRDIEAIWAVDSDSSRYAVAAARLGVGLETNLRSESRAGFLLALADYFENLQSSGVPHIDQWTPLDFTHACEVDKFEAFDARPRADAQVPTARSDETETDFMDGISLFDDILREGDRISMADGEEAGRLFIQANNRDDGKPQVVFPLPFLSKLIANPSMLPGFAAAMGDYVGMIQQGVAPGAGVQYEGMTYTDCTAAPTALPMQPAQSMVHDVHLEPRAPAQPALSVKSLAEVQRRHSFDLLACIDMAKRLLPMDECDGPGDGESTDSNDKLMVLLNHMETLAAQHHARAHDLLDRFAGLISETRSLHPPAQAAEAAPCTARAEWPRAVEEVFTAARADAHGAEQLALNDRRVNLLRRAASTNIDWLGMAMMAIKEPDDPERALRLLTRIFGHLDTLSAALLSGLDREQRYSTDALEAELAGEI